MINDHGVAAARGASTQEIASNKERGIQNTARVLNQALERHITTLNDTTASADARNAAAVQVGSIVSQINNMKSTVPMFGAASNAAAMHEHGLRSADENMQIVNNLTQRTVRQQVEIRDNGGRVVGMQTQEVANPRYNETLARTMREQTSRRADPQDPDNYTQAA